MQINTHATATHSTHNTNVSVFLSARQKPIVHHTHSTHSRSPHTLNVHLPAHTHSTHSTNVRVLFPANATNTASHTPRTVEAAVAQARAAAVAKIACTHAQPPPVIPTLHAQYCYCAWHTHTGMYSSTARLCTPRTVVRQLMYTHSQQYTALHAE